MRKDLLEPWKNAIKKSFYKLHNCSICGYECGWFYDGQQIVYDSGCYCIRGPSRLSSAPDESLYFYLEPEHGHISNIEKFIEENR